MKQFKKYTLIISIICLIGTTTLFSGCIEDVEYYEGRLRNIVDVGTFEHSNYKMVFYDDHIISLELLNGYNIYAVREFAGKYVKISYYVSSWEKNTLLTIDVIEPDVK